MSTPIQEAYSELRDIVKKNPQSLGVNEKLNILTQLVHAQIIENIKGVYGDGWEKSSTYASFQNNVNERAQMERNVLNKEIGVYISIVEINQQISMAMMTAMTDSPNIFSEETGEENTKQHVEAPKTVEEPLNIAPLQEVAHKEENEDPYEYLKKNKEVVLRLVRDKKAKWFALRKASDFTTFYIELDGTKISYKQIAELFLGKGVLNTNDNMLKVHKRLTEQVFDEESIENRFDGFRNAIKDKGDWLELENSTELRNDYRVDIKGNNYTYRNLIALFGAYVKNATMLSNEVYKELSIALFGKNYKNVLKSFNDAKQTQKKNPREGIIDFEDEKTLKEFYKQQESSKKVVVEKVQIIEEKIVEKENDDEGISIEELMQPKVQVKRVSKELEKEKEYENNRRMIVAIALEYMDQDPKYKKLWFGPYTKEGQSSFKFEYEGKTLDIRVISNLTGFYGIDKRIPFPKFIEHIFGKDFVEIMRKELEEEEEKEAIEKARIEAEEKLKKEAAEQYNNENKEGADKKEDNKSVETPAVVTETVVENEKEEKTKMLSKKLEDAGIFDTKKNGLNQKTVLSAFDKIVEECIKLDNENIEKNIKQLLTNERGSITCQCRKKYPKADPALKNLCKNEKFIQDCKTEFLLIKQDEVRTKIMKFFKDGNVTQIKSFYWGLVKGLENIDFAQECYDHIIDSVENKYRESHLDDDKGTIDELKAQENAYKNEQKEKEIDAYCKSNDLTREEYSALLCLIKNLKRKKAGQDMERYLLKLRKRRESLRGEEFDNDFTDEVIDALKTFGIKLVTKDAPKRKNKKA